MSTKTEGIAQCSVYCTFLSFVEREVQVIINVFIIITFLMVDSGRNNVILHSQYAGNSFYRTGSTQQVSCHRLSRADIQFISVISKYILDSFHF